MKPIVKPIPKKPKPKPKKEEKTLTELKKASVIKARRFLPILVFRAGTWF